MEKMKYFFFVFFTAAFIIPESIEKLDANERMAMKYILNLRNSIIKSIKKIDEIDPLRCKYNEVVQQFQNNFTRSIGEIDTENLLVHYKHLIKSYEYIVAKYVEDFENEFKSIPNRTVNRGICYRMLTNFRNNIAKSLRELQKVELYPGNLQEFKRIMYKQINLVNIHPTTMTKDKYVEECAWHYRKMVNSDNIQCEFYDELMSGMVYLPSSYGDDREKRITGKFPCCKCDKVGEEFEYITVLEFQPYNKEVVFTIVDLRDQKYILELQSGWQNIDEKLIKSR